MGSVPATLGEAVAVAFGYGKNAFLFIASSPTFDYGSIVRKMKRSGKQPVTAEAPAERLRKSITSIVRVFKVQGAAEPGSPYAVLNPSDLAVLALVAERPGCIMRDVAAELGSALSTATTVVDRLVRRGLISRERDERNRRIVPLRATAEGARLHRRFVQVERRNCQIMLEALAPDERPVHLALMEKIAETAERQSTRPTVKSV